MSSTPDRTAVGGSGDVSGGRGAVRPTTAPGLDLPSVVHDYPAAVLLIDPALEQVAYVNDLARQLAPDVTLPIGVEEWSRAAGLQVASGGTLSSSSTPLTHVAAGDPESGRQISAALHSHATEAREALWAIGMPLHGAPEPLRARSLLVLMPLRFPDAVTGMRQAAATDRAHRSVLASGLAVAISDPNVEDDPLIWVSRNFEQLTGYTADEALGRNCRFLQGPDTDPQALQRMRAGLAGRGTVSETLLNYRQDGSAFYNHLVISPVFDGHGRLTHRVSVQTDVTGQVLAARELDAARLSADRARQALSDAEGAGRFGQLLLTLSEALTATTTVEQVAATITDVVTAELGVSGGGLLLADATRTRLEFVTMSGMPAGTEQSWAPIGWHDDSPLATAVRTRRPSFYPDSTAMLAAHPGASEPAQVPATGASAHLPLVSGGDVVGAVFLYWEQSHPVLEHHQAVLQALARYSAQAVQRATLLAERRSAAEVLQRSLLTRLPEPDDLEIGARYVPAASGEDVGGDWYDAIELPDGATCVVIGDVTGHDMAAAAHMGQLRGLLRAFAFDRDEPPAAVVARLDRTLDGLRIDGLATLVLARIERTDAQAGTGPRTLRWTNAGHPPPILLHADGSTETLDTDPDLMVGLLPDTDRSDHTRGLPPGSVLLLFTDGLVEHRGRSISDGISDLQRVLASAVDRPLEQLLDHVVRELVGDAPDDDCAILAIRAHRGDRWRPAGAATARAS